MNLRSLNEMVSKTSKRVVVIADMHCGSCVGLTPPDWQQNYIKNDKTKRNKYASLQQQCWDFYYKTIMKLKVTENSPMQMEMCMKESGKTIRDMVKVK